LASGEGKRVSVLGFVADEAGRLFLDWDLFWTYQLKKNNKTKRIPMHNFGFII